MSIQGNLSIINQICQNSGLTGPALDSLRTRLENLSEEQLRVELASSRRDLDKGVTVEIAEEKIEQASGFEEKVISTTDESGNVTETIVTLHAGKPLKMVKKVNGNKVETTTYTYHDATEESAAYVTLETEKSNQSKVTTNVLEVDENGTYAQEDFVDRTTVSMSGEKQYVYTVDNLLYEQVTLAGGGGSDP